MRLSQLLLIAATGLGLRLGAYAQIPTLVVSGATSDKVTISTTFTAATENKVTISPTFTQIQSGTSDLDKATISPTFTAAPSTGTNNPESAPHLPGDTLNAGPSPSEPFNAAVKLLARPAVLSVATLVAGITAFVL